MRYRLPAHILDAISKYPLALFVIAATKRLHNLRIDETLAARRDDRRPFVVIARVAALGESESPRTTPSYTLSGETKAGAHVVFRVHPRARHAQIGPLNRVH